MDTSALRCTLSTFPLQAGHGGALSLQLEIACTSNDAVIAIQARKDGIQSRDFGHFNNLTDSVELTVRQRRLNGQITVPLPKRGFGRNLKPHPTRTCQVIDTPLHPVTLLFPSPIRSRCTSAHHVPYHAPPITDQQWSSPISRPLPRDVPGAPRSFTLSPSISRNDDADADAFDPTTSSTPESTMKYSLAPFILRRPWLARLFKPAATWYVNAAGYRQMGLRFDDLLEEENDTAQKALKRLSPKESYERIYRIRRAVQCSYQHKLLPKDQWTTSSTDASYLRPIMEEVAAEKAEKDALDSMAVIRKH
ncbi:hypothetical protein G7046_g7109 [Stylonectria norvegica]|nr:hypothetical protein G7046_g7109 [Stylonectria norvegica]